MRLNKLGLTCAVLTTSFATIAMADVSVDTILPSGHVLHDLAFCDLNNDGIDEIIVVSQDASRRNIEISKNGYDWWDYSPWTLRFMDSDGTQLARTDAFFSERIDHNEGRILSHMNCNGGALDFYFGIFDKGGARSPGNESFRVRLDGHEVKLIGYDSEWLVQAEEGFEYEITSINFLTHKMQLKLDSETEGKSHEEWIDLKLSPEVLDQQNYPTTLQNFNYEDFDSWVHRVVDLLGQAH